MNQREYALWESAMLVTLAAMIGAVALVTVGFGHSTGPLAPYPSVIERYPFEISKTTCSVNVVGALDGLVSVWEQPWGPEQGVPGDKAAVNKFEQAWGSDSIISGIFLKERGLLWRTTVKDTPPTVPTGETGAEAFDQVIKKALTQVTPLAEKECATRAPFAGTAARLVPHR